MQWLRSMFAVFCLVGCTLDEEDGLTLPGGNNNDDNVGNPTLREALVEQCEDLCDSLALECGGDGSCECAKDNALMDRAGCLAEQQDWYDCLEATDLCGPGCDTELDASLDCLIDYCQDHLEDTDCPRPPPPPPPGGGPG